MMSECPAPIRTLGLHILCGAGFVGKLPHPPLFTPLTVFLLAKDITRVEISLFEVRASMDSVKRRTSCFAKAPLVAVVLDGHFVRRWRVVDIILGFLHFWS